MPTVVLLGTLDTKGREYGYVKECLIEAGVTPFVIDFGVLTDPLFEPDIVASQVAEAGGAKLAELRAASREDNSRANALEIMTRGLIAILNKMRAEGCCDAVFGLGGSSGTSVVSTAMRALPLGIPKLLLSTMASGNIGGYIGTRDICVMYSVTDIAGLNRISRPILRNAAYAVAGMVKGGPPADSEDRPLVAVTMFGITTVGALHVIERLESDGFETVVFHANGSGCAMEELIDEGLIDGVIEYTLSELTDYTFGGAFHAGPHRLEAAGRQGIPQVVVPGGIEVLNFGPRHTVPKEFDTPDRKIIIHNPFVCAARLNAEESARMGTLVAEKLNVAQGPVAVVLPLYGKDMYEAPPDGPWIDKEKDAALFDALRSKLKKDFPLIELDMHINDRAFAEATVDTFLQLWMEYKNVC